MANVLPVNERDLKPAAYTWPGGYPIYYISEQNNVLCPKCAGKNDWEGDLTADCDVNYEDGSLYCDQCSKQIECAYPSDDDTTATKEGNDVN